MSPKLNSRLWAPWRLPYIQKKVKDKGCIFCNALADKKKDDENLLVYRGKKCFVILNLYPYNNGHLMVVPKRHLSDISKLTKLEREEIFELLIRSQKILMKKLSPHGFNMGLNLGEAAGAGVKDHLHFHIVPRWSGDTNFMSTLSDTKVISQSLKSLYDLLKNAL